VDALGLASRWDPRGVPRLLRLLRDDPPAVLHSHLKHADLLAGAAARRTGLPHVSTLHLVEDAVGVIGRVKRDLAARRRIRTAASTIAVSEAVRAWYLETFPEDPRRVAVIRNGIPDPGEPEPGTRERMRAELGVSSADVLAAVVAVMRPEKGHDDVLEAAAGVDGIRFVLAGSGPEESRLRRKAASLGLADSVVFAGFREDVADLLAAADVIVHPSHADALPTALIHGLAAGLPAVGTRVGGIPEIVTPDTGVLVDPGDPGALREAICGLAGDPEQRERLGAAARARYLERFEGTAWARRLRAIYDSIAAVPADRARW
jgi:glycosyltransferase involved in cell wall biosynthesis